MSPGQDQQNSKYKVSVPLVLKIEESGLISLSSNLIDKKIETEIHYSKSDRQTEAEISLERNNLTADVRNAIGFDSEGFRIHECL
jgi:hypothetical protein